LNMVRDRIGVDALEGDAKVLSVQPRGMGWVVEKKSTLFGSDPLKTASTKSEALDWARKRRNKSNDPVKIEVKKQNGSTQKTIGP